jgi:hypothetical protein
VPSDNKKQDMAALTTQARRLLSWSPAKKGETPWLMTGVDVEGCDLRCGIETARLDFEYPLTNAQEVRAELTRLAGKTDE